MKISISVLLTTCTLTTLLLVSSCGGGDDNKDSNDEPTVNQVTLGKKLFFDQNLSSNGSQSCGDCHDPAQGFADPDATKNAPVSEGAEAGAFGNRNAPTAAYAAFIPPFGVSTQATVETASKYQGGQFLDGRTNSLIEQAKDPFLNLAEMNNTDEADVVNKVRNAAYAADFEVVFGAGSLNDVETAYDHIATAIAAFEASDEVNPFSSKFDAVMAGTASFSASEQRGFELFKGDKAKCANCHLVNDTGGEPSLFTDFRYFNIGTPKNPANPVYQQVANFIDAGLAANPAIDPVDISTETGKFRTPTLRNIELTAPYMHNGVYQTLEEVIRHYDILVADSLIFVPEVNANIASELNAGTDVGLGLQPQDYIDIENFLKILSDGYR